MENLTGTIKAAIANPKASKGSLATVAKAVGIPKTSRMNKDALVEALTKHLDEVELTAASEAAARVGAQIPSPEAIEQLCKDVEAAANGEPTSAEVEAAREELAAEIAAKTSPVFDPVPPRPAATPANTDAKRTVPVEYVQDGKAKKAKFGSVEAAEKWATKALQDESASAISINGHAFELPEVPATV